MVNLDDKFLILKNIFLFTIQDMTPFTLFCDKCCRPAKQMAQVVPVNN
jgi:hypothetical protein